MQVTRKRTNKKTKNKNALKKTNLKYGLIFLAILIITAGSIIALTSHDDEPSETPWGNAPDFTLKTLEGNDFTLSDHLGKVIVLDFMASWCSWCKPQMGELEAVLDKKGDDILIVSVDVHIGETRNDLEGPFGDYLDKWTFVLDNYEENVGSKYQVSGIPKLVIIDEEGNIYYSDSGLTQSDKLLEEINKASE